MTLTKEQLEAIEIGDWERSIEARNRQLQTQRDAAESLRQKHLEFAEKMMAERDEARAIARRLLRKRNRALDLTGRVLKALKYATDKNRQMALARDEAKRHLRQLLHALDNEKDGSGKEPSRSTMVDIATMEARRYLQAPAGRDEE